MTFFSSTKPPAKKTLARTNSWHSWHGAFRHWHLSLLSYIYLYLVVFISPRALQLWCMHACIVCSSNWRTCFFCVVSACFGHFQVPKAQYFTAGQPTAERCREAKKQEEPISAFIKTPNMGPVVAALPSSLAGEWVKACRIPIPSNQAGKGTWQDINKEVTSFQALSYLGLESAQETALC